MTPEFKLLDKQAVLAEISQENRDRLRQLVLLETIDSTNLELQRYPKPEQPCTVIVADRQSAGRGRRGRLWHSPPGRNIYLSLGWKFQVPGDALSHLPLCVAVTLTRALQRAGMQKPGIKWPNDIQVDGRKLAGVLIEVSDAETHGAIAVIGIGVNVRMPVEESTGVAIDQPWTDVCTHLLAPAEADFRDRLCGLILDELLGGMTLFGATGFQSFRDEWGRLDVLDGKEVEIATGLGIQTGVAAGTSGKGGLLVRVTEPDGNLRTREFFAGDVQVRAVAP